MTPRIYRGLTTVAGPLIGLYLRRRRAAGKEDAARFDERFGYAGAPRPAGPLAWIHAASVGEAVSMLPPRDSMTGLIDSIRFCGFLIWAAQDSEV